MREHGYNIEVVDYCLRWSLEEWQSLCQRLVTPDLIFLGIGSNLFMDRDSFNPLITWFRETYPNIPIVLGGNHVLTRTIPCVDYYIEGYAELAVLALLDFLSGRKPRSSIKWSDARSDVNLIDTYRDYGHIDTSDLSIKYLPSDFIEPNQVLALETARGCLFKCKFCTYPLIGKKKFDYMRDVDNIEDELRRNHDQWGTTKYMISEDTFNDNLDKLKDLEKVVSALPFRIEFVSYIRFDLVMKHPESVDILRNLGIRGAYFGIETFDRDAGRIIGKGWQPEKIKDGLLWWKEQMPDVSTHCSMIVGLPQDQSDYYETVEWFARSKIEYWGFTPLYITNLDKTIHTSEFSRNYSKYGLEPMSQDEIDREIEIDLASGINQLTYNNFINQSYRRKVVFWRDINTGKNYFQAARLAVDLNALSKTRRVSPWNIFDWVSLGYSVDEMIHWGWHDVDPHVPEQEILSRTEKHVHSYKSKKLGFDYGSYYKNLPKKHRRLDIIAIS